MVDGSRPPSSDPALGAERGEGLESGILLLMEKLPPILLSAIVQ